MVAPFSFGPKGVIALFFMFVPSIFVVIAGHEVIEANTIAWNGQSAVGQITRVDEYDTGDGEQTFVSYAFRTASGEEVSGRQQILLFGDSFAAGEIIEVLYEPERGNRSVMNTFLARFSFAFLLLFTVPFFAIGFWLLRKDQREQRELGWADRRY